MSTISLTRLWALLIKEFNQLKRDHTTFFMIISIPLIQLLIFGYAINTNPRYLPMAVLNADSGQFSRTLLKGIENTQYFTFSYYPKNETDAETLLRTGKVSFILNIPSDFSRKLVRGESPSALLEADATDPVTVGSALAAASGVLPNLFKYDFVGPLSYLAPVTPLYSINVHARYNPSSITQYNIVPGLMGVILTLTLVMVTSMAITKEREKGTLESLLASPAKPIEVIIGKTLPYIMVGYFQLIFTIAVASILFAVPIYGSLLLLLIAVFPFVLANLMMGIAFSTMAETQFQASQMSTLFFLPSIMLSGYIFPFYGMPVWAQVIGEIIPLTHFVRITRGIMLKGNTFAYIWPDLWPILLFMIFVMILALKRYRQTLD